MSCVKNDSKTSKVSAQLDTCLYHEKQSRELCALHALNNLFQKAKTFTKKQLDEICGNLSPHTYINPHRSMLGMGNYDINVLMSALELMGYDTLWFDKRRSLLDLELDRIYGFILNVPTDMKWGFVHLPIQRKHWVAVRKVNDNFYNLDSKLDRPELIGNDDQLTAFLKEQIQSKDKELLMVVGQDLQKDIWSRNHCTAVSSHNGSNPVQDSDHNAINKSSTQLTRQHVASVVFKESGV